MVKRVESSIMYSRHALKSGFTAPTQEAITRKPSREPQTYHVGVADLDVYAGYLPLVLEAVNAAQATFKFQKVFVPMRAGLAISGDRTKQIVKNLGQRITKNELQQNVYAPDLYDAFTPVQRNLTFDCLGLLVSRMIIDKFEDEDLFAWNLCWSCRGRIFVTSAFDLQRYSVEARRPIEACVASMVSAAAFATIFSNVETHEETRGCIFDYCENRDDMIVGFRKLKICPESLALFPPWAQKDAQRITEAISKYRRPKEQVRIGSPRQRSRAPTKRSKASAAKGKRG